MSDKSPRPSPESFTGIAGLASGFAEARIIQVALKLGLFAALASAELDQAELARAVRADARATGLLARALVAMGLLARTSGRFALTEVARRFLIASSDEYLGAMILFDEALWDSWGRLEQSIRTGRPARTPDMFQRSAQDTRRFIDAMDSLVRARGDARFLAETLDLATVARIADIGGGPGTYMAALVERWPRLHAAIYDLPATLEVARRILAERSPGARGRIDLVAVDYLRDELPGPCDALFMSNVIHSETAETNAMLMGKCFRALAAGGMLIIKDHVMNAELTEPYAGAVFSVYLLLATHGRNYSFDEIAGWLRDAGFTGCEQRELPSPPFTSSLVLARKP